MAPDIPEPPHHPHRPSGLPRWLEWTTAISALIISVCSIGIAVYNANIESRLLKASSYPYLFSGFSDGKVNGQDRVVLEFLNNGVGPADERSLKIKLGDRYVTDVAGLVRAAVGPADGDKAVELLVPVYDNQPTRFVASRDSALIFRIDKTPENARYWDLFDHALTAKGLTIEFCYCSVFEECWSVRGRIRNLVETCVRDPDLEFIPRPRRRLTWTASITKRARHRGEPPLPSTGSLARALSAAAPALQAPMPSPPAPVASIRSTTPWSGDERAPGKCDAGQVRTALA